MAVLSPSPLGSRFIAPPQRRGPFMENLLPPQLLEPRRVGGGGANSVLWGWTAMGRRAFSPYLRRARLTVERCRGLRCSLRKTTWVRDWLPPAFYRLGLPL